MGKAVVQIIIHLHNTGIQKISKKDLVKYIIMKSNIVSYFLKSEM